jgi:hypothetical protein
MLLRKGRGGIIPCRGNEKYAIFVLTKFLITKLPINLSNHCHKLCSLYESYYIDFTSILVALGNKTKMFNVKSLLHKYLT